MQQAPAQRSVRYQQGPPEREAALPTTRDMGVIAHGGL
jgi:hypothetical protein